MKKIIALIITLNLFVVSLSFLCYAKEKSVTIVFTNDLHSYIDTIIHNSEGIITQTGGFAKIKTVIDRQKTQVLTVDAGDFSMGTLYQAIFSEHAPELRIMGEIGYDAVTLGNHEFDYGTKALSEMLITAKNSGDALPHLVYSNINFEKSTDTSKTLLKTALDIYGASEYTMVEKNGVKIAVFGLLGRDAHDYTQATEMEFDDIIKSAQKTVEQIKANEEADMIVALSHSGTDENEKKSEDQLLAQAVDGIDVIVSGHTHTAMDKPIIVNNTVIVSAGEYGENIGVLTLSQNNGWSVDSYQLVANDDLVAQDKNVAEKISSFRPYINDFVKNFGFDSYDAVIANSPYDFETVSDLYDKNDNSVLGNLISDSYRYAVNTYGKDKAEVDVAIVPVGVIRSSFKKGNITVANAYEVNSLGIGKDNLSGTPLCGVYLYGKELKAIAEVDASVSSLMSSAQLYTSGLKYAFNTNRLLLNRVTDVSLVSDSKEKQIEDDKLYYVVAGLYTAKMLGTVKEKSFGLITIEPKDKNARPIENFDDTIIYDENGAEIKEWTALCSYLSSFEKKDGISTIDEKYALAQERKIISDSRALSALLEKPNKVFYILLVFFLIVLFIIIVIVCSIVKKAKEKQATRNFKKSSYI